MKLKIKRYRGRKKNAYLVTSKVDFISISLRSKVSVILWPTLAKEEHNYERKLLDTY